MKRLSRIVLAATALLLLTSLASLARADAATPTAHPAAASSSVLEVPHASYDSCPLGNVCFYTGFGGTGSMCAWSVADPDWTSGSIRCSWATTHVVESIYNRGTSNLSGVAYYTQKNYVSRVGCTRQGKRGDLAGTYHVLSHQWINGSCG